MRNLKLYLNVLLGILNYWLNPFLKWHAGIKWKGAGWYYRESKSEIWIFLHNDKNRQPPQRGVQQCWIDDPDNAPVRQ